MPYLPTLEDVSPTLARAVLPTYLHHVMDASETLADFALRRLAKNEATRQELVEQIAAQREVCNTPLVAHSEGFDDGHGGTPSSPFSQHTPLSPGARAAKRAADDEKLSDLERALHAANVEASDIETRLRIAEIAAERLRGAPRELRAVSRLLVDVITDLEEYDSGEDEFKNDNTRHGGSVGSASSGRSTTAQSTKYHNTPVDLVTLDLPGFVTNRRGRPRLARQRSRQVSQSRALTSTCSCTCVAGEG